MRKLWMIVVVGLLTVGAVGARDARELVIRSADSSATLTYRIWSAPTASRPVADCPGRSGRFITLICPADATGCAALGEYGGSGFLVTAPPGTRRVTDSICTEPGNMSYFVTATPGNVQCFPKTGEARAVAYRCAGVQVVIN